MKVFFSGGEKGSHRSLLLGTGVSRVAVNLTQLNIPKRKEFSVPETFPGCEVLLYTSEGDEDVTRYDEFIRAHQDALTLIVGRSDYDGEWLGSKYVPVWNDGMDLERLAWICQKQGRVAISDRAINAKTLPRIRSLAQRWGAQLVGLTSKPDVIDSLPWDTVVVASWTSVIRYGETQVWDGHGLRRYPAQQKESARRKHRSDIVRLGVDVDAVMEDNVQEVGRLAIKSWQQWESRNVAYDPNAEDDESEFSTSGSSDISTIYPETHTGVSPASGVPSIATNTPQKRHESQKILLPVMGIEQVVSVGQQTVDEQGEHTVIAPESIPVMRHSGTLLRQCDSCYLASRCPAFTEHAECGYNLPVEIRTKDQLQSALRALVEMQVSRVLFARFAEELEGQGLDPAVSKEIDRVFALVEKFKDISDTRELVRMEIETRSGGGVLSRLFGAKAGETAKELPGGAVPTSTFDALALDIIDMDDD